MLYPELMKLLRIMLILPATNAVSERSFSSLRRVKTYMRASMSQQRLNHLVLLHVYPQLTEDIDPQVIIKNFAAGHHGRQQRIAV